jgi:hypothetical protein
MSRNWFFPICWNRHMPIPVSCQCGASFQAPDQLAGKVATCPKCQEQLPIPAFQASSGLTNLLDELGLEATTGAEKCPHCYAELQPNAVICTACGVNLQTGASVLQKEKTHFQREAPDDAPSLGDSRLDHAAQEMAKDAVEAKKSHDPIIWWIYLAVLDLVLSLCVMAAVMMMTHDDLKSRRMMMVSNPADGQVLYNDHPDNIVVVAAQTDSYEGPPPYKAETDIQQEVWGGLRAGTWGRRGQSQGGYTRIDDPLLQLRPNKKTRIMEPTPKDDPEYKIMWVNNNRILDIDGSIIKTYIDNPRFGAVKSLKYGFYKGLHIGMLLMAFLSGIIAVVALGQITFAAFQENVSQGALCLTIGYAPYYALMRWYKLKGTFKMLAFGCTLLIFAFVVRLFVPVLLPLVRGNLIE